MAREDLHGSDASTVMSVVTGSTSTQEFINSMQSRDALSRTEANAASDAANTLNTSMNRSERLSAIEKQIANLKTAADEKAASAQQAAASAQTQRDSLDQLRAEGETRRAELESQQSQLNGSVAKQAAQTVMLQSQVDSFNRQYAAEQAAAANQNNGGNQGQTRPGNNNTNSGGNNVTPAPTPTPTPTPTPAPAPSTNNNSGQGTSNGDYGNGYVAGQCTWWAYERRRQMGIGTPSYLGNGGQWYATAPSYGLRVDHSPQVGAAISFLPGSGWCRWLLRSCGCGGSGEWQHHHHFRNERGWWPICGVVPHTVQRVTVLVCALIHQGAFELSLSVVSRERAA